MRDESMIVRSSCPGEHMTPERRHQWFQTRALAADRLGARYHKFEFNGKTMMHESWLTKPEGVHYVNGPRY